MPRITIIGPEGRQDVELHAHNTLGRHPNNTVQVLDRIVSKEHCHIDLVDGRYLLRDLGSLNGSYVNGERISELHRAAAQRAAFGGAAELQARVAVRDDQLGLGALIATHELEAFEHGFDGGDRVFGREHRFSQLGRAQRMRDRGQHVFAAARVHVVRGDLAAMRVEVTAVHALERLREPCVERDR